jgi:hypothetical protein
MMTISHLRKSLLFVATLLFLLVALGYTGSPRFVLLPAALALWAVSDLLGVPPTP